MHHKTEQLVEDHRHVHGVVTFWFIILVFANLLTIVYYSIIYLPIRIFNFICKT